MRELFAKFIESELGASFLLITCGLPATAKSGMAEIVSQIRGYPLLSSDLIRMEVLKNEDIFDEKVASDMEKRTIVYEEMFRRADEALKDSGGVILDATFLTQPLRRQAAAIATSHGLTFVIMETDCPQAVALRRIQRRTKEDYESNALTERAYLNNKRRFEKVDMDDLKRQYPNLNIIHLKVDTRDDGHEYWYITSMTRK